MRIWVREFRESLQREFQGQPRVATLATVDETGHPRARSIVCRQVEDDGTTWYASDARSARNFQLRSEPRAQVVFWLPTLREQYRISGRVDVIRAGDAEDVRLIAWMTLSDRSRALFHWPAPGAPLETDMGRFPEKVSGYEPQPPDSFELLVLVPTAAERLALGVHPHLRVRYAADAHWAPERLNP